MRTYLRIIRYGRPLRRFFPAFIFLTALSSVFGVLNFSMLIPFLDLLFNTENLENMTTSAPEFSFKPSYFKDLFYYHLTDIVQQQGRLKAIYFVCSVIMGALLLSNVFLYLSRRIINRFRGRVIYWLRRDLYLKILGFHLGYFSNKNKGDLVSRLTNDVNEIEKTLLNSFKAFIKNPIYIITLFVFLFYMSVKLTFITLIVVPVTGAIIGKVTRQLKRKANKGQTALGYLMEIIDETINGNRIIKTFNGEAYMSRKFDEHNRRYSRIIKSMGNRVDLSSPLSQVVGVMVILGIIGYGVNLVTEGSLKASALITFIAMYTQILNPSKGIMRSISNVQRGLVAGKRLLDLMEEPVEILNKPDGIQIKEFNKGISFSNVSFAYEDTPVLSGINLEIPKGANIAFVGPSGGGKSTIANLIPRFYDPVEGQVLLDDTDLREIDIYSLREQVGIVSQDPVLFNDTVYNNIAFGNRQAPAEDVYRAAEIAMASDFIQQLESGYETYIGDKGMKLSGGQRQRISIARAVLKNPPVLILDEATSALDSESEYYVQEALFYLMKNRTSVIIAHRLSTIQRADKIFVIDKGQVIEEGSHEELLKNNGMYKKLIRMQQA